LQNAFQAPQGLSGVTDQFQNFALPEGVSAVTSKLQNAFQAPSGVTDQFQNFFKAPEALTGFTSQFQNLVPKGLPNPTEFVSSFSQFNPLGSKGFQMPKLW